MGSWPWLPLVALALLLPCLQVLQVDGSIHKYKHAVFSKMENAGNARFVVAGSEGLYRSKPKEGASGVGNGKSYIRCFQAALYCLLSRFLFSTNFPSSVPS